jgi:hypothetical protein
VYGNIRQFQLNRRLAQKGTLLRIAVEQDDAQLGAGDGQWNSGHATATANVKQALATYEREAPPANQAGDG